MNCVRCGNPLYNDKHIMCWMCRHGHTLRHPEPAPTVCECDPPKPERLGGIWGGLDALQCGRCGRAIL